MKCFPWLTQVKMRLQTRREETAEEVLGSSTIKKLDVYTQGKMTEYFIHKKIDKGINKKLILVGKKKKEERSTWLSC